MHTFEIHDEALTKLERFIHEGLATYSKHRNYDYGVDGKRTTSNLSHYISHRILCDVEILNKVLDKYPYQKVEKFIEEIFWRVYWRGWLEHRPKVWEQVTKYTIDYSLNPRYEKAINGTTHIECFNSWVNEIKEKNFLHNHTRMWFASIWIFTLDLPWQLGARFFMEYLLDGDSASNTLSWRWVAGLHSRGKHYLAKKWNIEKFTNKTFPDLILNEHASPIKEHDNLITRSVTDLGQFHPSSTTLLMFESELNLQDRKDLLNHYEQVFLLLLDNRSRQINLSPEVMSFKKKIMKSFEGTHGKMKIIKEETLESILVSRPVMDVVYPFVGENLDYLKKIENDSAVKFNYITRETDLFCWSFAQKGFFNFKKYIPKMIERITRHSHSITVPKTINLF